MGSNTATTISSLTALLLFSPFINKPNKKKTKHTSAKTVFSMPNSKKYLVILTVAVLVLATVGISFFILNTQPPTEAKSPDAGYIENSQIYLISANSRYGDYKGSPCFIINVTVRSDYTVENPPDNLSSVNTGAAFFILTANLYDKSNNTIEAQRYIPPHSIPSYNQQNLGSGDTLTYDIYLTVTQQRHDIDHYDLVFDYLGSIPAP